MKATESQVARVKEILEKHGIKMTVDGCGCCGSPWVSFEYDGEKIAERDYDFFFDMCEK